MMCSMCSQNDAKDAHWCLSCAEGFTRLCRSCNQAARVGKTRCQSCAEKENKQQNQRWTHLKTLRLCKCGKAARVGKTWCQSCAEKDSKRQSQQWTHLKTLGLCFKCGKASRVGRTLCQSCVEKNKQWKAHRKTLCICVRCGEASRPEKILCQSCTEKDKQRKGQIKDIVFTHYGNECVCCGEANTVFLTIDHINNDGNIQRRNGGGMYFYQKIISARFPTDLQILCWNCNLGKHHNGGVCPHKELTKVNVQMSKPSFEGLPGK